MTRFKWELSDDSVQVLSDLRAALTISKHVIVLFYHFHRCDASRVWHPVLHVLADELVVLVPDKPMATHVLAHVSLDVAGARHDELWLDVCILIFLLHACHLVLGVDVLAAALDRRLRSPVMQSDVSERLPSHLFVIIAKNVA